MSQRLQDIMTRQVATVQPNQTLQEAANIMNSYNVGAVPVVENGQCVGMITDRDIAIRASAQNRDSQTKVRDIMTHNIVTAPAQMDVHEAAALMAKNQIRRLPVVDNNQVVGIVALGDLAVQDIYQNEAGDALSSISQPSEPGH
ncbi:MULTISPECIES: CBS domain-containing protein [Aneurinibacillus]|jgi:CBS domain-containing protein|uniref:CBS domain-containing protein YhcV n=1 Tax=Aneurinibacillus danicus TaxID=267746 RepID=A0A511V2R8_9BACL|nr:MULTISPECIES: CBS domain-containing protein [Aneurinibacillus]GEN33200.1 CBS domain-containing protein YhcV [Aneurinibacillus danicus]